jgi:predicted alpha/beta superfamily hydrolase
MLSETYALKSDHVGDEFEISVGRCSLTDEMPTDVLVLTDSTLQFGTAMDVGHGLLLTKRFPSLLVVGIGYPGGTDLPKTLDRRQRDLTPTAVSDSEPSGGAPAFLRFLREELSPWLAGRYGAAVDGASYFGHSYGGLFGAWVLLHEPETFRHYALSSPSVWWDGGVIFEHEAAYAADHDHLAARVFVGVGADETPGAQPDVIRRLPEDQRVAARREAAADTVDMVAGSELFADALRSRRYPDLALELQVQPGEDHATAQTVNLSRALRYFWDQPKPG